MRFSVRGLNVAFLVCSFVMACGCVAPGVRRSAIRWNLQSQCHSNSTNCSKALELASRSQKELGKLMQSETAPTPDELIGTWYGINKGYGAAMAGLHQDVKVIEKCGAGVSGHNILVVQVPVEDLQCKGWRPQRDPKTGLPKTMGNFTVQICENECGKKVMRLDYSQVENRAGDPSRFLLDELVMIEPGLILGRARVRFGWLDMPVAYFVLMRGQPNHIDCDSYCDEPSQYSKN